MGDALEKGARFRTPAQQAKVATTVNGLAEELAGLWSELTGRADVGTTRRQVEEWARAHPLGDSLLSRESTAPLFASLIDRSELPVLTAAASALEDLQDLSTRIDLYALSLPRQARWQAEAAIGDLAASPEFAQASKSLQRTLELLEPLSELAGDMDALLQRERAAIFASVDRERLALERFVRDERGAVFAQLRSETDAALRQADEVAQKVSVRRSAWLTCPPGRCTCRGHEQES